MLSSFNGHVDQGLLQQLEYPTLVLGDPAALGGVSPCRPGFEILDSWMGEWGSVL